MKKPSSICQGQLRSISNEKQPVLKIQSRQMMKEIVTDFIIRSLSSPNLSQLRQKHRKYQPLFRQVEVNQVIQSFQFGVPTILEKYVLAQRSKINSNCSIETLVGDILELIDQLSEKAIILKVTIDGNPTPDAVLAALIGNYIRQKEKQQLESEFLEAKKMNNKHKKVLLKERHSRNHKKTGDLLCQKDSDANTHRMSRTTVEEIDQQQLYKRYIPQPATSKLKQLVNSCNIFDHPQKLEALRREKIINQYCKDECQYQQALQKVVSGATKCSDTTLNPGTAKFLQDWINQIDLSQYFFNKRYGLDKDSKLIGRQKRFDSSEDQNTS